MRVVDCRAANATGIAAALQAQGRQCSHLILRPPTPCCGCDRLREINDGRRQCGQDLYEIRLYSSGPDRARVFDFLNKFFNDPAKPGLSTERVQGARDPNIWAARITGGLRTIYHHLGDAYTLLYAGQHDEAFDWAARRKLEHHPVTGTLQIVDTTERVQESLPPSTVPGDAPRLFAGQSSDYLLSLGVPTDWLPTIREIADEDQLLTVADKLPEEVAELLLRLAGGELVTPPAPVPPSQPISASPDNLRRFYVVQEASESATCSRNRLRLASLSASFPTRAGNRHVQWPGQGHWVGRHGQDRGCHAPSPPPGRTG